MGDGIAPHIPLAPEVTCLGRSYFVAHLFIVDCHIPPARSQSAWVVYCERSLALPDGLAEGLLVELPEPVLEPAPVPDEVPEPVDPAPLVPDGALPEPVAPEPLVPDGALPEPEAPLLPLPLLDCAAARAGAKAIIPMKSTKVTLYIVSSSEVWK